MAQRSPGSFRPGTPKCPGVSGPGEPQSPQRWATFRKPQPLQLVCKKVLQYTSNFYGSTPPICIAVLSWLLSFKERETLQYASHLYCSTPPICTAVRPPFVRQYFWKNTGGWGHRNVSEKSEAPGAGGLGTPFWTLFGLFGGSGPEGPGRPLCQAGGFPRVF